MCTVYTYILTSFLYMHMYICSYHALHICNTCLCVHIFVGLPTIEIIRVANECTYIYVLWMNNSNACGNVTYNLLITPDAFGMAMTTTMNFFNFTDLTPNTSYNIVIEGNNTAGTHFVNISRTTKALEGLFIYVCVMLNKAVTKRVAKQSKYCLVLEMDCKNKG